ncbi:MAG: 4Fe-4S binding protein [Coriobacteriales bacterium]|nr:4Fe-4S binding protein [Coriobacteriales bacterium]
MDSLLGRVRAAVTSRWFVKTAFLSIFLVSCIQLLRFLAWARGAGPYVRRPEAVAGLLPVGHFTSFFAWVRGGGWDQYLPAGLVIILGAVATSLLLKRGFCGWICPVGTVCEASASLGRRLFGRNFVPPKPLDIAGRAFRYLLAALAVFFLITVPVQAATEFRVLPYMWTADMKILLQFGNPVFLAVIGVALGLTALIGPFWCRYLCPLGGIYSALGIASPCAVRRDAETCIDCGRCSSICHAYVDVQHAQRVWNPECDGCMDCVKVCPVDDCLVAEAPGRTRIAAWAWPVLVVVVWGLIWGFALASGNWNTPIPADAFKRIVESGQLETRTPGGF